MTETTKPTIQNVEQTIEAMDAPALPRKERKSKTIEESQIIQIEGTSSEYMPRRGIVGS